jgi:hypothetical protein
MMSSGMDIAALSDETVLVTGEFLDSATFGQGELNEVTLEGPEGYNDWEFFIARYNADGTLAWAERAGGILWDRGYGIAALSDGSSVVTGYFSSDATFGEYEVNETVLSSAGAHDVFVARYNSNGTLAWAERAGGENYEIGFGIDVLPDGSAALATGYYSVQPATFGLGEDNETTLYSAGNGDVFVAEYCL